MQNHLKNDYYVLVDFLLGSYEESYDSDGCGVRITDDYAVSIIDDQGCWAYSLTHCLNTQLLSFRELCGAVYLPYY